MTFPSTVEAFVAFSQDRVQQRRLRRPSTFLQVEVLTVFSSDRVPQRLPLRMLNFRLVEVFTVYAQDRVFRRFLNLNTTMMLLGVHAEVEDLLEVLSVLGRTTTARGRARRRRFAGRFFTLPSAAGCGFIDSDAVAEFGDAAFGGFRVPVSWQGHFAAREAVTFSVRTGSDGFMEAYDMRWRFGVRGLASPHPFLGATTGSLVWCLRVA